MSTSLMATRRFAPLFWCQFFAAFGDNFLKTALVFLILFEVSGANSAVLITLAGATLIAPFFFLSGLGGEIADRYDKALVAQRIKLTEIAAAAVAVAGFGFHSIALLFVAVFMFGTLATLFGPIKYGILPDLLKREELPSGNALIEAGTFLAILLGTIVAGFAANGHSSPIHFAWLMLLTALASFGSSLLIPKTAEAAPGLVINANVLASTASLIRQVRADRRLWWGAVVASWFWLVGALVLSLLPPLVSFVIGGSEVVVTLFLTIFSIAVGLGSGLAAWLAAGRIVLLPTLVAAVLLGLFSLDLGWAASSMVRAGTPLDIAGYFAQPHAIRIAVDLAGLAIAGGLFIVPVFTAVQVWAGTDRRARVVAAVNVLNAAFMVGGALLLAVLQKVGLSTPLLFVLLGAVNLAIAIAIGQTMPASWLNDFLSIVFRAFFRLEVKGLENIDKAGHNAIIALNHVSFLDPPIATAILPKRPVFAIDVAMSKHWWIQPFLRFVRTMALDPLKPFSLRGIINAVREGNMLVIFPEGRITVTGSLMKIYDGAAMIADKSDAMIVPARIDGAESTIFSRLKSSQVHRRLFPKITVTILEPVKLKLDPALKGRRRRQAAGAALYDIMSDLMYRSTPTDRTLSEALIEAATVHGVNWLAIEDPISGQLTYKKLLTAIAVLGRKLMPLAAEGKALGVMLPTSNGGVVTTFAVLSAGRVPAMINFSSGAANIRGACRAAEIDTILTSRAFVEKGRLDHVVAQLAADLRIVYLEDIRPTIGTLDKLRGLLHRNKPLVARKPDDWAVILFTSGTEGTPKGVVLSHRNMLTNVAQCAARIDFGREDKLFNAMPIFHSFGFTGGVVLPLISGVPLYLYPSPLHYRTVPELVYGICATAIFGTDTFLNGYARMANPYDFRSLRYIIAGAEPVREATRRIYLEKFGLRILEGYGLTETSPVLALNTPMFNKFGSVGRLLPGMTAKLEHVEGIDEGGRLYVSGPNVMLGYLRADHPGVLEPPHEGWHDSGDIVTIDGEGFISIKGRAKRFAKVGGEMVSLAAVEMLAAELWPDNVTAVAAIPDARKGERLIMVTDKHGATRSDFIAFARGKHASELMFPAEVVVLDKLPLLGSGKVDNMSLQKFVGEQAAAKAAAAE
ncbi:MAG TPA: acyl-[ACP]--phospholipid O-acyltransferase [Xanthobacteraceae bacterium]|nr:acyl-[ACP]--phospholipid O-acyltransferase [Xanthobacteraceae bacterium]